MKKVNFLFRHTSYPGERSGIVLKWLLQLPVQERAEKINRALSGFWSALAQKSSTEALAVNSLLDSITSLTAQIIELENEFKIPLDYQQFEQPLIPIDFPEIIEFVYRYQSGRNYELLKFLNNNRLSKSSKILIPLQAYWEARAIKALGLSSNALFSQHAAYNFWQLKKQLFYLEGLLISESLPHSKLKPSFQPPKLEVPTTPYFLEDLVVH